MGNVVMMPAAARPEQIASLMLKSLNGTAFCRVPVSSVSGQGFPSFIVARPGPVMSVGCPQQPTGMPRLRPGRICPGARYHRGSLPFTRVPPRDAGP